MATIRVTDVSDVLVGLPELRPFSPPDAMRGDLFICANGFEPRVLTIPELLGGSGAKFNRTAYFSYSTNSEDNEVMRPRLASALQSMSAGDRPLEIEEERAGTTVRELLEDLRSVGGRPSVCVDISAASNRLIMIVLKAALESPVDVDLTILYSEAGLYHPTLDEHAANKAQWSVERFGGLEWGVGDVVVASDEFPGYHVDQLPDFVMIIAGYNRDRVRAVISHADPSLLPRASEPVRNGATSLADDGDAPTLRHAREHVAWLLGTPHMPEDAWRRDAQREIHDIDSTALERNVSTFDYRETIRVLESLYEPRRGDYRFSLTPMGSKMQAVGASLFCYLRPDVRVLFAKPRQYNASLYSEGCKATWKLECGSVHAIRALLERLDSAILVD
jgi:hypothetical protein